MKNFTKSQVGQVVAFDLRFSVGQAQASKIGEAIGGEIPRMIFLGRRRKFKLREGVLVGGAGL